MRPLRDDQATNQYLENFYKVCVETLFQPLIHDIPVHQELKGTYLQTFLFIAFSNSEYLAR